MSVSGRWLPGRRRRSCQRRLGHPRSRGQGLSARSGRPAEANIVTIAKVDPLFVEAYLPVRYYGKIKIGDVAVVHPGDPIGGDHNATVSIVDQVFDAASGTFGVRLNLPNADYALPGGLRCRVDFKVPEMTARDVDASDPSKK